MINIFKRDKHEARESKSAASEKELIETALFAIYREQRAARLWTFWRRILSLSVLVFLGVLFTRFWDTGSSGGIARAIESEAHTALVKINGIVSNESFWEGDVVIESLNQAFKNPGTKAVIVMIDSPGGSPVRAAHIHDEIKFLSSEHPETPVYSVIGDLGASAAYYIAVAANDIYADPASLIGSIGVVSGGFGFVEAMKKLGLSRRLYTAGEHKGFLDPFQPEDKTQRQMWQGVLDNVHEHFINRVKASRKERLSDDPRIFTGFMWDGTQALKLGLIDGFGSPAQVARDVVGVPQIVEFSFYPTPFERFFDRFGARLVRELGLRFGWQLR